MTNAAEVHVAIDPEIKEKAETILEQSGFTLQNSFVCFTAE